MTAPARSLDEVISSESFLEYAFLRWVLTPATRPSVANRVHAQVPVSAGGHDYRLDYELRGDRISIAVELDGFSVHGSRSAFTYDRLRQNDITATGRTVVRFSYDAIRTDTARCITQLQAVMCRDPALAPLLIADPQVETPQMDPDPLTALTHPRTPAPRSQAGTSPRSATPSTHAPCASARRKRSPRSRTTTPAEGQRRRA